MKQNKFKDIIIRNEDTLWASNQYPFLDFTYLEEVEVILNKKEEYEISNINILELGSYPKFKNITPVDISNLRLFLHSKGLNEVVKSWCKSILHYIEIGYSKLKRNENKYGRSKEDSIKIFNQIMALFVEYYLQTNDLIYLNTALKIADLKWITPTSGNAIISTKVLYYLKIAQMNVILKKLENE